MDNYMNLLEACMAIHVIATLGMDTWSAVSPVVLVATELPMYH